LTDSALMAVGACVAADSAFPVSNECFGRIVTPLKEGDIDRASEECRFAMVALSNAIISLRQVGNCLTFFMAV
jgi:hypothetical protein